MVERSDETWRMWPANWPLFFGFISLFGLLSGVGIWSMTTYIAGAVIASGTVQSETNRQVIQHPDGGVVGEIYISDGDIVKAGDSLVRFDDSQLKTELAIIENQYFELLARKALLEAEGGDQDVLTYGAELTTAAKNNHNILTLMNGQAYLLAARRISLSKQKDQFIEKKKQLGRQIEGVNAQITANQAQHSLIDGELSVAQTLLNKGLVKVSRSLALRREKARIAGKIGSLVADVGRLKANINEVAIQSIQLDTTRREKSIENMRDVRYKILELSERRAAILNKIARLDVRTPMSGIVYGNQVFAMQSVVQPAEPMMYIIPNKLPHIVQAKISATHIDRVYIGQDAALRFASFNQRTTPALAGVVAKISADIFTDKISGQNYYQAEIVPKPDEMEKLGELPLLSGIPVEVFIKTQERRTITYLVKPIADYFNKAFREE